MEKIMIEFLSQYGFEILSTLFLGIATFIGASVKKIYNEYITDKKKEKIVKTVVKAVNQMYKDLGGEDKLTLACDYIGEMLNEKGITCTDLEIRLLIEEAVTEAKEAFKVPTIETAPADQTDEIVIDAEFLSPTEE